MNEAHFAERWAASLKQADYVMVADTGSTDGTPEILRAANIVTHSVAVKPWRFDDARNAALAMLPSTLDVVISLDMDEVLTPDWRTHLEIAWTPGTTRLHYGYVWSWTEHGEPDVVFHSDKIAGRFTHRWTSPVHETLTPTVPEKISVCDSTLIEHRPDPTKSRGQYLPLLQLAVAEAPDNDRNAHYLGREYYFHGRWGEAIAELQRHLSLKQSVWKAERAASMRYIARAYEHLGEPHMAYEYYARAVLEDGSRESLINAAKFALAQKLFHETIAYCQRALALPVFVGEYMAERYARAEGAFDLMAVALWHLGHKLEAISMAEQAVFHNPRDTRLQANLEMMQRAV